MDLSLIPRVFLLAALALTASTLAAAPPPPDPQEQEQIQDGLLGPELKESPPPVKEQRPAPTRENLLDRPHDFLSRSVEAYSRKLDNFFSDPNRAYDSTGSTLQIRSHVTFFEGGVRESKADVHANISLPNTGDRLKLVVQRGVEAATQTAAERDIKNATGSAQVAAPGAPQDNNYYLGLKALAAEVFGVALSAEAGAKFARPIDPYVRLRAFRDFNFSQWQIRTDSARPAL